MCFDDCTPKFNRHDDVILSVIKDGVDRVKTGSLDSVSCHKIVLYSNQRCLKFYAHVSCVLVDAIIMSFAYDLLFPSTSWAWQEPMVLSTVGPEMCTTNITTLRLIE